MPTPFATSHYFNRFINVKKLVDVQYCFMPPRKPMADFEKENKLPVRSRISIIGKIRMMVKKDVSAVHKLL